MGRSPCCDENGLKKGPWTPEEDHKLVQYIQKHGHGSWRALPKLAGLNRCGKSCRLRWTNYLKPDIKRGKFSQEEEQTILNLHSILGNKWSAIATHLPGRTDNEIKNFWNTHLKKKLIQMGFDPMTHRPRTDIFSSLPQLIALANLKELIIDHHHQQWDHQDHAALRLQAEAVQLAKLQCLQYLLQTAAATSSMAANTSNDNNIIADMEAYNNNSLFIKENNISSNWSGFSQLESPNSCSFGTVPSSTTNQMVQSEIPFSQLSDLQVPCNNINITVNNKLSNNENMGTDQSSSFPVFCEGDEAGITKSSSSTPWIIPNNSGDGCSSSSSYGGGSSSSAAAAPSFWPELLLEDPFILEIA